MADNHLPRPPVSNGSVPPPLPPPALFAPPTPAPPPPLTDQPRDSAPGQAAPQGSGRGRGIRIGGGVMTALLVVAGFGIRFFFAAQDTHERGNQERIARTAEITDAIDTGIENGDLQLRRPGETYPPAAPAADVAPGAPDLAAFDDPTDAWLVWAAAEPDATNAVLDATGEHCALNQPADTVWFLAGSFGETLERECAVPHGRTLVVPAINSWCPADDFEVCREANSWMNEGSAGIELDGERVGPNKARQSPILRFDAAIDNPMLPAGPNETQMIGQWAVIDPPAPGVHTLRITAEAEDFAIDVTYTLTIG